MFHLYDFLRIVLSEDCSLVLYSPRLSVSRLSPWFYERMMQMKLDGRRSHILLHKLGSLAKHTLDATILRDKDI